MRTSCIGGLKLCSAIVAICVYSCAQPESYCDELRRTASDRVVQEYLVDWVAENVDISALSNLRLRSGGGMWPGFHHAEIDFDWDFLSMPKNSQIRIVGRLGHNIDRPYKEIYSVFFGSRSRNGILIKVSNSNTFGIAADKLKVILPNVAIVCEDT